MIVMSTLFFSGFLKPACFLRLIARVCTVILPLFLLIIVRLSSLSMMLRSVFLRCRRPFVSVLAMILPLCLIFLTIPIMRPRLVSSAYWMLSPATRPPRVRVIRVHVCRARRRDPQTVPSLRARPRLSTQKPPKGSPPKAASGVAAKVTLIHIT